MFVSTVLVAVFIGRIEDHEQIFVGPWRFESAKMNSMFVVDGMNMDLRVAGARVAFALKAVHGQIEELLFVGGVEVLEFGAVELLRKCHFGVFAEDVNEFFDGDIAVVEFCGGDVGEDISVGAAGQFKAQFGVGGGYVVIEIDGQFEFG